MDDELRSLAVDLRPVVEAFDAAGHRLYLVGGIVRDLLLGERRTGDDVDLTTDAPPAVTRALLAPLATALWTQGERFGTIGAHVAGRIVEITTHRAESYHPGSRKPEVVFGTDLSVDLSRRDFTINAMARQLPSGELVDPFDGAGDLAAGRLRTPLDPEVSFSDDPLRMLRAARFTARFHLRPDADLVATATRLADRLGIVSVERIHDELERLLAVPDPTPGLDLLTATGLLERILPEVVAAGSVGDARLQGRARWDAVRAALPRTSERDARRALLLWPVAEGGGETAVRSVTRRIRYSSEDQAGTARLAATVAAALADDRPPAEVVRRATAALGPAGGALWAALGALRPELDPGTGARVDRLVAEHAELVQRGELTRLDPPLDGAAIMAHLALPPGPEVGRAIAALREAVLVQGPLDEVSARRLLDRWRRDQPG